MFTVKEQGQHVSLRVPMLMPVSFVDQCQAMTKQQRKLSGVTLAHRSFTLDFRAKCTDSGNENFPCELGLSAQRIGEGGLVHTRCMIHKTATIHETSVNPKELESTIRKMLHVALALGNGMMPIWAALLEV